MCSFRCYEDLTTCGEGGIRTHGGDEPHNGFRDRPIQPLWHLSQKTCHVLQYYVSRDTCHLTPDTSPLLPSDYSLQLPKYLPP
jgi:hypothetical protein